jgi:hypothetical protein
LAVERFAVERLAVLRYLAAPRLAVERLAVLRFFAAPRLAVERFAAPRLAVERFAVERLAVLRFFAAPRLAVLRFAVERLAVDRFAVLRLIELRLAPARFEAVRLDVLRVFELLLAIRFLLVGVARRRRLPVASSAVVKATARVGRFCIDTRVPFRLPGTLAVDSSSSHASFSRSLECATRCFNTDLRCILCVVVDINCSAVDGLRAGQSAAQARRFESNGP